MRIGAHVRGGGTLVPALEAADAIGAEVVQVFTQSPRAWKPTQYSAEVLSGYRAAQAAHLGVSATYCHATYLINLASPDPEILGRSRACLETNLAVAGAMGSSGLVLHIGSHRGAGFDRSLPQVVDALAGAIESVDPFGRCPILLENTAGAGDTVGRSFEELAAVIDAFAPRGEELGVCLDTQHLWASGVGFATVEAADAAISAFDATIGLGRLCCLHLNDSKVPFGANRDRHENVGDGTIGSRGLGCLLAHPRIEGIEAVLEVPGAGNGPRRQDIERARRALDEGRRMWAA